MSLRYIRFMTFSSGRFLLLICLWLTLSPHANACWVEKIQSINGSLRIHLIEGYKNRAVYITRDGKGEYESPDSNRGIGYFDLSVGDRAFINVFHDNCTYTAEIRPEGFGVSLKALSYPHGVPPLTSTGFLLPAP
jgi:hypothetical protein